MEVSHVITMAVTYHYTNFPAYSDTRGNGQNCRYKRGVTQSDYF